jgi:hypothetical protein
MPTAAPSPLPLSDPPALLAIARAAHQTGDRRLERAARKLLRDRYGIEVSFRRSIDPERTVDGGSR